MRFGVFGIKMCGLSVSLERSVRIPDFEYMAQRQPGTGLTFFSVRSGLEFGGGAQKLFSVGLASSDQGKAQVEIGLEDARLGCDRLAVGSDRVVGPAERVIDKSQ